MDEEDHLRADEDQAGEEDVSRDDMRFYQTRNNSGRETIQREQQK